VKLAGWLPVGGGATTRSPLARSCTRTAQGGSRQRRAKPMATRCSRRGTRAAPAPFGGLGAHSRSFARCPPATTAPQSNLIAVRKVYQALQQKVQGSCADSMKNRRCEAALASNQNRSLAEKFRSSSFGGRQAEMSRDRFQRARASTPGRLKPAPPLVGGWDDEDVRSWLWRGRTSGHRAEETVPGRPSPVNVRPDDRAGSALTPRSASPMRELAHLLSRGSSDFFLQGGVSGPWRDGPFMAPRRIA